jgi:hypothetical protein
VSSSYLTSYRQQSVICGGATKVIGFDAAFFQGPKTKMYDKEEEIL